jgi:aryl-alcohol dehydrogenase-like predicted oxidoreductase
MAMDDGERKGASRRYIMAAVEASLTRLKTDWLDLYQVHRHDPLTPIEETLRALDDLVRAGKVRYVGCSNFSAAQIVEAQWTARHHNLNAFVSAQDEYSLLKRGPDAEHIPTLERYGLGLLPYYPLASGLLTGKHKRGATAAGTRLAMPMFSGVVTDANFDIVEKLEAFAKAHGHTLLELAFSWLAARPTVGSIIAGATKPEQIDANVKAASWELGAKEMEEIDRITKG